MLVSMFSNLKEFGWKVSYFKLVPDQLCFKSWTPKRHCSMFSFPSWSDWVRFLTFAHYDDKPAFFIPSPNQQNSP